MRVPQLAKKEGSRIDQHFEKLTNYSDGSRPSFLQAQRDLSVTITIDYTLPPHSQWTAQELEEQVRRCLGWPDAKIHCTILRKEAAE